MDDLDEIVKNQMISSYENNATFRTQLINTLNNHYTQNIKYHIMWLFFHSFSFAYPEIPSEEYKMETANFSFSFIIILKLFVTLRFCWSNFLLLI